MLSEATIGFYSSSQSPSSASTIPPDALLNVSKWFSAQHSARLPNVGCKLSTVITESDVSRWAASFDNEIATLGSANDDVVNRMMPDLTAGILAQEGKENVAALVCKLCPIPPFVASAAASRTNAKQLAHRSKWLSYRQKVPLYQQRSAIVASVRDARVVSIVGGPHCGKSTQIPQLLTETDMFRRKRIIVATATSMSAVLLVKRLREEKGDTTPVIAHCIPVSSDCTEASQIVVCTYEVLFRTLLCDVRLLDVGCVVLDDLHVHNTIYMDLCLTAIRDIIAHPTANKDLRLILNCRDDVVEGSLLQYLQPLAAAHKFERHVIPESVAASTAVMYLDDAVQWLQKVNAPGATPTLVRDPASELGDVANHVQVLARVLDSDAAGDIVKSNVKGLHGYWLPLLQQLVAAYDAGDRVAAAPTGQRNAVVIILPSAEMCSVVERYLLKGTSETTPLNIVSFCSQLSPDMMLDTAARLAHVMSSSAVRPVILTTSCDVLNANVLPFKNIGCLLDTCREDRLAYDSALEADRWTINETVSKATMRHHRLLLHNTTNAAGQSVTMSLQLVTRQALHSQRTKQTAPHPATIASLDALLPLLSFYHLRAHQQQPGGAGSSLALRFSKLLTTRCWDLPSNQIRGDALQRAAQHAESWLQHMGALDSKFSLTGLGGGMLVLGLPWQVSRLMLFGALFAKPLCVAILASLWLVGDVFANEGDDAAQTVDKHHLDDARKFFSKGDNDQGDLVTIPYRAFCMWRRTVSQTPEEEEAFIVAGSLSKQKLAEAQRLLLSLLQRMRQQGVSSSPVKEDMRVIEHVDVFLCAEGDDGDHISMKALQFCATGAALPNTVHTHKGALGVARLVDAPAPSLCPIAALPRDGCALTSAPVQVALSKVGAASASHVTLSACGSTTLPAAVVCCGVGVRQPLSAPTRCRGWMSPLTNVWRQTTAARFLPPPPQISARTIPVAPHNPTHPQPVQLELDGLINIQTNATTAALLAKIRDFSKRKLSALLSLKEERVTSQRDVLEDVLVWLEQRQATQEEFLRDRRSHTVDEETPRVLLQPYVTLAEAYERPTLVQLAAPAHSTFSSAAPAGTTSTYAEAPATSLTFSGIVPPDQATQALIRRTAETIGKNANRDGEANFMQRDTFAFLRPDHAYHEYYLHILKKEAPHLDWLGDDVLELEQWLQELETTVEKEVDGREQASYDPSGDNWGAGHRPSEGMFDASAYEEVSEEQYAAELQRQQEVEAARRRAEEERERQRQQEAPESFVPKPGSTTQFLSPDASAHGVGSGMLHGGNTLLQTLMAMRSGSSATPDEVSGTSVLLGPAAASAASIFGNLPGSVPGGAQPEQSDAQLSAQELLAIIGGVQLPQQQQPSLFQRPALKPHPLTIPPPPLPSEATACRTPSVIVEPLPSAPSMNLPLVLAKALGETLDMKVGPTLIIGDVARIEVPSSVVETRAIALKHFYCLGSKLTITRNDRIIDNPNRGTNYRIAELKERLHGGRGRGGMPLPETQDLGVRGRGRGSGAVRGGGRGRGGRGNGYPQEDAPQQVTSFVPATIGHGYLQPPSHLLQSSEGELHNEREQVAEAPQAEVPSTTRAAGAFTDSDEE
jgi:hypothetical protein